MFKIFALFKKYKAILIVNFLPLIAGASKHTTPPKIEGTSTIDPAGMLETAAKYFAGIVLAISVIIIIYGGFLFVTAAGDPEKVSKARNLLIYGIVGIVVAVLAFGIAGFAKTFFTVTT